MLPALVWNSESQQVEEPTGAWGELHLSKAAAYAGRAWTDDGALYEERALKHRPDGHTRTVPWPPALVRIMRAHLAEFNDGPGGRLFCGAWGRTAQHHLPACVAERPQDGSHE